MVGVARAVVGDPGDVQAGAGGGAHDAPLEAAAAGERSHIVRLVPTSSSASAQRRSLVRSRACSRRTARSRRGGRAARCRGAPRRRWRRATGRSGAVRRPELRRQRGERGDPGSVVLRAGRGRHVSLCAITIRRQSRRPGSAPITLRERPFPPETVNGSRADGQPGAREPPREQVRGIVGGVTARERERRGDLREHARHRSASNVPGTFLAGSADGELARAGAEAELEQRLLPGEADDRLAVDLLDREAAQAAALDGRGSASMEGVRRGSSSSTRIWRPCRPRST